MAIIIRPDRDLDLFVLYDADQARVLFAGTREQILGEEGVTVERVAAANKLGSSSKRGTGAWADKTLPIKGVRGEGVLKRSDLAAYTEQIIVKDSNWYAEYLYVTLHKPAVTFTVNEADGAPARSLASA